MQIPSRIIFLSKTKSTNLYLLEDADLLKEDRLIVTAETQTAGRGRRGKKWEEGPQGQLYFSLCLHTKDYPCPAHSFTLIAGLALAKALDEYKVPRLTIKWPNDILSGSKKMAGILCESFSSGLTSGMVIGIGVNLRGKAEEFSPEVRDKAISLQESTNLIKTPRDVILNFSSYFQKCLKDIKKNGLQKSLKEWESLSASIGTEIHFEQQGQWKKGVTVGLGPAGELVVESNGEAFSLFSGETSLTPPELD